MAEGVDFSGSRPSGLCLALNGKTFAGRYFGAGGAWKHATKTEVTALTKMNVAIVSLVEGYANDANLGFSKGVEQARLGHNAAVAAGMPSYRPLYFAVDFDATTAQLGNVSAYMDGAASVIGRARVGAYGGFRTIDYLHRRGKIVWCFQTYAWSAGKWYAGNHIEQYKNNVTVCQGAVDLCRSKQADFGQWKPGQQSIGDAPPPADVSTTETPWEFGDLLNGWSNQLGDVAESVDGATRAIESM